MAEWRKEDTFVIDGVAELDGIVMILEWLPDGFDFGELLFMERSGSGEMESWFHHKYNGAKSINYYTISIPFLYWQLITIHTFKMILIIGHYMIICQLMTLFALW